MRSNLGLSRSFFSERENGQIKIAKKRFCVIIFFPQMANKPQQHQQQLQHQRQHQRQQQRQQQRRHQRQ